MGIYYTKSGELSDRSAKRWGNKQSYVKFGYDHQVSFICIVLTRREFIVICAAKIELCDSSLLSPFFSSANSLVNEKPISFLDVEEY